MIHAWTDASAGKDGGGWAWIMVLPDGGFRWRSARHERNKIGLLELTAACEAVEALPEGAAASITTDAQYVFHGATNPYFARELARKPEDFKNVELWARLFAAARARRIVWRWVKGHANDHFNTLADRLAVAARAGIEYDSRENRHLPRKYRLPRPTSKQAGGLDR